MSEIDETQQSLSNLSMSSTTDSTPQPPPQLKSTPPSFSIWPPTDRTRDAVRTRLIETLTSQSVLTKRYGTVPHNEATDAAKVIEEEAFIVAGKGGNGNGSDDGIEILQVYSKEISKRMLETVKSRNNEEKTTNAMKVDEEDAESNAPAVSERTDSVVADDE